ncbi:unnamed protein product [Aureobasidium uvarum]|uniref:Uncharacterized protein n=1 Tax=Aureobasidium uvarum TaxID=2773716 RepID=A0A9N8KB81_9PEZI|nr:unnamed protein product [Aureobasidium uvarum]
MRGPPPQSDPWSPTVESVYRSPNHPNSIHQPQHSQSHHNVGVTGSSHLIPGTVNGHSELPAFGDYLPLHDLASVGMTAPTNSTTTPATTLTHFQYGDNIHTHHPYDSMSIHFSAPPLLFEPVLAPSSATQPIPPKRASMPEQNTQILPDNGSNLENMRHERNLLFQKAATELDQVKCDTGSSTQSSKAWEDAWQTLQDHMTNM